MRALVTGGAGFIGCNLADRLAAEGHEVIVFDAFLRSGVERNIDWLEARHPGSLQSLRADVRDARAVADAAAGVDVVFHLAAQVAVTASLANPLDDFETNVRGTLNILEAARERRTPVIFASTNKVYGDLGDVAFELEGGAYRPQDATLLLRGVSEDRPLDFHTPYGCSKGAADQYVLDYARSFGVPTCVLRMSCVYGPRQIGTEDQGWVAHFLLRAMSGNSIVLFGDGRQVRDILHVTDAVDAYMAAWARINQISGRAFNLGGGPANAVSLLQLIAYIGEITGRDVSLDFADWRPGDQRYFVSDSSAARRELRLGDPLGWRTGVVELAAWLSAERTPTAPRCAGAL